VPLFCSFLLILVEAEGEVCRKIPLSTWTLQFSKAVAIARYDTIFSSKKPALLHSGSFLIIFIGRM
jgi:hypothetical protein